jgi:hypothetical protein
MSIIYHITASVSRTNHFFHFNNDLCFKRPNYPQPT